jgi:Fe-S cluster biosynthesis and repair protein YggX
MNLKTEYEQDFQQWIEHHITLLKEGRFNEIDAEHLIEELEDMGKSNVHELESRLIILIAYLLKWHIQLPIMKTQRIYEDYDGKSWRKTIIEQRAQIIYLFKKVPSLKSKNQNAINNTYSEAVTLAVDETGLPESLFPIECPYTVEQLLDKSFYPESKDC